MIAALAALAVAVASAAPQPARFGDEAYETFNAQAAGDAHRLVVTYEVRERKGEPIVVHAAERGPDGAWTALPDVGVNPTLDGGADLVMRRGAPCFGTGETVACLKDGRWIEQPRPPAGLFGLTTHRGRLLALLTSGSRVRVVRLGSRWRQVGRSLPGGIANFGTGLTVGIERLRGERAVRTVWRFAGGRWRRVARLRGAGQGSQTSGPLVQRRRIRLGVNEVAGERWTFSVYSRSGGAWRRWGPLNQGDGKAQGVLSLAGSRPYAIWQENRPTADGAFDTEIYASRLRARARRLWSGRSIGPSDLAVVRAQGADWALYMPGRAGSDPRLAVAVEPLTTRETR